MSALSVQQLAQEIGKASLANDLDRLEELEECFTVSKEPGLLPLVPNVILDPDKVSDATSFTESDQVLGLANSLSRAKRRIRYHRRKWFGFEGPVIVSEGDSWFQYPIKLDDVIDVLMQDFQILSLGAAGDLLTAMAAHAEYISAIADERADFFLLSGGGNDMLHSGRLREFLRPWQSGMEPRDALQPARWNEFLDLMRATYSSVFSSLIGRFPRLTILCHGYDYAVPRSGGKWLGGPLADRGVPRASWNAVIRVLIDDFNGVLTGLAAQHSHVVHVDCRGTVGESANSWFDELHPRDSGYARVAELFADQIRARWSGTGTSTESLAGPPLSPPATILRPVLPGAVAGQFVASVQNLAQPVSPVSDPVQQAAILDEAIIDAGRDKVGPVLRPAPQPAITASPADTDEPDPAQVGAAVRAVMDSVLSDATLPPATDDQPDGRTDEELQRLPPCSSLAAWRAHLRRDPESIRSYNDFAEVRARYEEEEPESRVKTRLEMLPESDVFFQERIIGRSNLEQINFLARGERAARTVGRISVLSEYGIPAGTGSGFLVGPGLLLTNHHVISDISQARSGSYVLFDYEFDADNRLKSAERFELTDELFITDKKLDFTFVSVAAIGSRGSRIEDFGRLKLVPASGKALKGEPVSIIQHPGGLPKQIAIRDSTVVGRKDAFVYYYADTNSGSSGSPVVNDQWFPVALHHRSVPDYYKPCHYVANRGIRISEIHSRVERAAEAGSEMASSILERLTLDPAPAEEPDFGFADVSGTAAERLVEPFHELPYDNRTGYDEDYLGVRVRMPLVKNPSDIAAPRIDSAGPKYLLTYEHFSVVVHRHRRLAAFTAANVDRSPAMRRPESGKSYSRKALGGLGANDKEKWFEDPRISSAHQLPDKFFEKDRKAFDKGHLTMRAEVAWGHDYAEVRRANGDTFHTTNCSPQVKDFNRSAFGFHGLWGELEELVLREAKDEKLCVFAGPVLDPGDTFFKGKDNTGDVQIQIPSAYWKVIVARTDSGIESFGFILDQDLSDVAFEFDLSGEWVSRRVSIAEVETRAGILKFPSEVHDADTAPGNGN